jgi:hypothetical protein
LWRVRQNARESFAAGAVMRAVFGLEMQHIESMWIVENSGEVVVSIADFRIANAARRK